MLPTVLEAGWRLQRAEAFSGASDQRITIEELRLMQASIPLIDLGPSRVVYAGLVSRLRHAGLAISDRRAIRLQRLLAASAMMCQRVTVDVSDFWVLRYIWDTLEQVEVLAKIVNDTLKSQVGSVPAAAEVHPRSVSADAPNPEHLGRDLDQIEVLLGSVGGDLQRQSWLRDRLSLLTARVEWVQQAEARDFLRGRIQSLMTRAGT
jgi:MoxR-like ATPase